MSRLSQCLAPRGSQHWLQFLVNTRPEIFDIALSTRFESSGAIPIRWLSPLQADEYAEYRDEAFLILLGIRLETRALGTFWPPRGPVWDGLAVTAGGAVLLLEAKANLPELESPASRASPKSARLIAASLDEAKPSFGAPLTADWMGTYYQYANRLAHLHLLRGLNNIPAYLVFLYFVSADDVSGPGSVPEWQEAIQLAHHALQIGNGPLSPFVIDLFIDVRDIAAA
jgi:hypothetical protein